MAYGSFPVTVGERIYIIVGAGGTAGGTDANGGPGGRSFISGSGGNYLVATGGAAGQTRSTANTTGGVSSGQYRENGGSGGAGGGASDNNSGGGGGGAGGYTGNGGAGGNNTATSGVGGNGTGGGGGGGGATNSGAGYGGGGVGFPNSGSNGTGGALNAVGTGGSGGANGTVSAGGLYGGGGGARDDDSAGSGGAGAQGVGYIAYVLFNDINPQPTQSIVTRALTHRFDAGDPTSYSGTGTVWTNLNGSRNLELVNSPAFISNASASRFVLNGTNNYMSGSGYFTGSAAKSHTLNLIGSFSSLPSTFTRYRFFSDNANPTSYGVSQPGTTVGPGEVIITQGTTDFNATIYDPRGAVEFVALNRLAMFTFVSSEVGIYFYLNGTQLGSDTSNTFTSDAFSSPTRTYWWGSDSSGGTPISMSIAHIMWYSASLTSEEVAQNYNALKSRYGI